MKAEMTIMILVLLSIIGVVSFSSPVYTITFESNGGTSITTVQIQKEFFIEKPDNPEKDGFLFDGWFFDDVTYFLPFDFDAPVMTSLTLYAKWIKIEEASQVAIEFISHHQSIIVYFQKGEAIIPPSWTLDGYELAGWFEHSRLDLFDFHNSVASNDMKLYAYWLLNNLNP